MSIASLSTDHALLESIEQYLARLESMVFGGTSSPVFFDELTRGLVKHCGATSVGVWILENRRAQCLISSGGYETTLPDEFEANLYATGIQPQVRSVSLEHSCDDRDAQRLLSSSTIYSGSVLVLDVWGSDREIQLSTSGLHEIVQGVTDIAVSFSLRNRNDKLAQSLHEQQAINQILAIAVRPGKLEDHSSTLARTLLEALSKDRVSVFQVTPTGARLLALVPSSTLNQRTTQVRLLGQLAAAIASEDAWLAVRVGEGLSLSPRLHPVVEEYLQASLAREIVALGTSLRMEGPQRQAGSTEGVVILEKFTLGDAPEPLPERAHIACLHRDAPKPEFSATSPFSESLLAHALDSLSQRLSLRMNLAARFTDIWRTSTLVRRLLVLGLASVLSFALLFLIPARLKLTADGSLIPKSTRSIFAPRDGVVENLYVQHGALVSRDQPLLKIRSPQIELEHQQLTGQVQTLEAKLLSLRSGKIKQGSQRASEDALRVSAEELDLKIQLLGVRKQLDIVTADRESLTLLSPLAGRVDGWDMEQSLDQRPVFHGQKLLHVFTPEDGWQLNLEIPDDVAGYILEAQRKAPCPVEFRIRSDPSQKYRSSLSSIGQSTQVNASQEAVVFAKVDLQAQLLDVSRSGAVVVAQVDCGRSSLGIVWFREIIEFLQRTFWL